MYVDWDKPIQWEIGEPAVFLMKRKSCGGWAYLVKKDDYTGYQTFTRSGRARSKQSTHRISNYEPTEPSLKNIGLIS